ncbi:phospholipase A-2-activating protein [Linnemannia elongata]|nr:phospholipase A-2-activating protein [Linnemannia elongata]
MTWQLSAILAGHKGDVKAVIAPTDNLIASVSRDKSLITWKRESNNKYTQDKTFNGHTNYVNSVAFIGASEANPHGLIVTGGSDRLINVWDPEDSSSPVYTLVGHTDNVCSLFADTDGHIVSGSWDKTAKIWRNWQCVYTLEGHTQAIWGVLELEHEVIVTASADKTIAMWKDGKKIKTITGHEDCVRSLALLPGIGFVSCGNDGAVIVWSNNGDPVQALDGHTSFVYSLATLPTGEIFSSGEDRTVRVWEHGKCTQTIIHPCVSVWCVAALPNGDIVSGGSDGFVRVFTRTAERVADADTLKAYDEENAATAIPSNQVGDIKKDDLPGPEVLGQPGKKDQEVKMVRVGNTVEAHMWSNAEQEWSKIGEVVDAVGQNRKQLYGGIEYDHVFDIDVGEGVPALKLPFNVTENPYTAAQEFLTRHDLPQVYLDQVADFITKNARAVSQGAAAATGDPLTGGSRYTPSQNTSSGLGSYNPWGNDTPKAQPVTKRLIPQLLNVPFKDANLPAIQKKLLQLNTELAPAGVALDSAELVQLDSLFKFLGAPPKQSVAQPQYLTLLLKIFNTWPETSRFPALDLLRLLALYSKDPIESPDLLKTLLTASRTHEASLMLVARLVVNFCETEEGREVAINEISTILEFMEDDAVWQSTNKNLKLAVATVYMSYSTLLLKRHDDDALAIQYVGVITKILEKERDQQVQYRLLIALGNLIFAHESAKESAAIFEVRRVIQAAVLSRPTSEKITTAPVANEVVNLL